jgi:hypothetical protein
MHFPIRDLVVESHFEAGRGRGGGGVCAERDGLEVVN